MDMLCEPLPVVTRPPHISDATVFVGAVNASLVKGVLAIETAIRSPLDVPLTFLLPSAQTTQRSNDAVPIFWLSVVTGVLRPPVPTLVKVPVFVHVSVAPP